MINPPIVKQSLQRRLAILSMEFLVFSESQAMGMQGDVDCNGLVQFPLEGFKNGISRLAKILWINSLVPHSIALFLPFGDT